VGIRLGLDFLDQFNFWPTPADDGAPTFVQELIYLVHKANLIVFLFNLIPAFPMDGGRILRGILHGRMGQIRSTIAVTTIALFAAAGMLVWGVLQSMLILAFIAVSVGLTAWMTRKRALAVAAEYDMGLGGEQMVGASRAFEASLTESRKIAREEEKERQRQEKEIEEESEIEARVDRLLAKISDTGLDSLTRRERAFLEKASRRKP